MKFLQLQMHQRWISPSGQMSLHIILNHSNDSKYFKREKASWKCSEEYTCVIHSKPLCACIVHWYCPRNVHIIKIWKLNAVSLYFLLQCRCCSYVLYRPSPIYNILSRRMCTEFHMENFLCSFYLNKSAFDNSRTFCKSINIIVLKLIHFFKFFIWIFFLRWQVNQKHN